MVELVYCHLHSISRYKFSIWNWLFKRGCLTILVAIKTGCTDGVYILEILHLVMQWRLCIGAFKYYTIILQLYRIFITGMLVYCLDILEPHQLIGILQMESYQLVIIIVLTRYSHCVWMNIHAIM